jgi:stage II sporulation protein M
MIKMVQRRSNSFRRNIAESFNYIKESKKQIFFVLSLFLLSFLIGLLVPAPNLFKEMINNFLNKSLLQIQSLNTFQLIFYIFSNNLGVAFFAILLGVFLGILPLFLTIFNGYVLGYVSSLAIEKAGFLSLWRLFPHGIFELPAIILSFAIGLRLGITLFSKNIIKEFFRRFKLSFKTFIFVILPLLLIAAIIEGILIVLFR